MSATAEETAAGRAGVLARFDLSMIAAALNASDMPDRRERDTDQLWRWFCQGLERLGEDTVRRHADRARELDYRWTIQISTPAEDREFRRLYRSRKRYQAATDNAFGVGHPYRDEIRAAAAKLGPAAHGGTSRAIDCARAGAPADRWTASSGLPDGFDPDNGFPNPAAQARKEKQARGTDMDAGGFPEDAWPPDCADAPAARLDPMKAALHAKAAQWATDGGPVAWVPGGDSSRVVTADSANGRLGIGEPRTREEIRADVRELRQDADNMLGRIDALMTDRRQNAGLPPRTSAGTGQENASGNPGAGAPGSSPGSAPVPASGTETSADRSPVPGSAPVPSGELAGDTPYDAARAALEEFGRAAARHQRSAEVLEAALTVLGFDRDAAFIGHITAVRETAAAVRESAARALHALGANHGQGAEYHSRADSAKSSAFRTDAA